MSLPTIYAIDREIACLLNAVADETPLDEELAKQLDKLTHQWLAKVENIMKFISNRRVKLYMLKGVLSGIRTETDRVKAQTDR